MRQAGLGCRRGQGHVGSLRRPGRTAIALDQASGWIEGFERGRHLDKVDLDAQDIAELSLTDVKVPVGKLLGEEGRAFIYLMENLPQERISIAIMAAAAMEAVLQQTVEHAEERKAFGKQTAYSFRSIGEVPWYSTSTDAK